MTTETALAAGDIYTAAPMIEIDGQRNAMVQSQLIGMTMNESEQGLSSLEMSFFDTATIDGLGNDFAFEFGDNELLSLGRQARVLAGDHNDPQEIFQGLISGLELVMRQDQQPILIALAEDPLQKARLTRRTRRHPAGSVRSIVEAAAADLGLRLDLAGLDDQVDDQLQFNESDLAFMRRLLRRFDADLQVVGDELQVAGRAEIRRNAISLEMGSQLLEVRLLADLAHQVNRVTYSGWDVAAGQDINVSSGPSVALGPGQGRTGAALLEQAFGQRSEHLSHVGAQNESEAQSLVDAAFARRARRFIFAEGLAAGHPGLRVGTHVTLTGVGPRFENTYFVHRTCHRYDPGRGYQTEFQAECAYFGG